MFKILTIALMAYALIHTFITMYAVVHFKKYNPERLSISRLGTRRSPKYKLFNASGFILGLLIILFGLQLGSDMSLYPMILVTITGTFLALSALFPFDRFPEIHDWVGRFLVISSLILSAFLIIRVLSPNRFSDFLILGMSGIPILAVTSLFRPQNKSGKESYPKHTWFWEWGVFTFEMLFIVTTCFSIIIRG